MKYSKVQYFFWLISGSEISVLRECENEYNRHANIGMMILITWQAYKATVENWSDVIPTLGWSGGLYFLAVTIGCAHTVLHLVKILFDGEPRRRGIIE